MELEVSKVNKESRENAPNENGKFNQKEAERLQQDNKRETITFENGFSVHKQGERYFLSVGDQELEITEEELRMVTERHDYAFDLIMEKRGKFWFNASIDNVGLNRETI